MCLTASCSLLHPVTYWIKLPRLGFFSLRKSPRANWSLPCAGVVIDVVTPAGRRFMVEKNVLSIFLPPNPGGTEQTSKTLVRLDRQTKPVCTRVRRTAISPVTVVFSFTTYRSRALLLSLARHAVKIASQTRMRKPTTCGTPRVNLCR